MRKLVLKVLMAAGIALGVAGLSVAGDQIENTQTIQVEQEWNWLGAVAQSLFETKEVEGEVTSVNGNSLMIKDDKGNNYSIEVPEAEMLEKLNSGDRLKITIEKVEPEG